MFTNADGTEAIGLLVEKEPTLKEYHEQIMSFWRITKILQAKSNITIILERNT